MKIQVMENIFDENDRTADDLRAIFNSKNVFVINLLGSPGSGKTSLLEKTLGALTKKFSVAVIEGDLFTDRDAARIDRLNVPVIQINTVGGCHLDAPMIKKAIESIDLDALDILIIENVGNLVCPAVYDLGETIKVTVLSITEGDDKPLKYPLIFKESSIVLLNKIDLLEHTNFDLESARKDLKSINPAVEIIETSCTKDIGLDQWLEKAIRNAELGINTPSPPNS